MKLLVSDFDGTFYTDEDNIVKNVKKIIEFRNIGHKFMLSSGRSYNSLKKITEQYDIPYDYLSCGDGSILYDKDDNIIIRYPLDIAIINEILKLKDLLPDIKTQFSYNDDYYEKAKGKDLIGLNYIMNNDNINTNFVKAFNDLGIKYPNYSFLVYAYHNETYYCIKNKGISKSTTIDYLVNANLFKKENIYTIGDNGNDYEMLRDYNGAYIGDDNNLKKICHKRYDHVYEFINDIEKSE